MRAGFRAAGCVAQYGVGVEGYCSSSGVGEMVSGMGVFSRVRVYVGEMYGLELMAFYTFACLVLGITLNMNFGTGQRAGLLGRILLSQETLQDKLKDKHNEWQQ